MNLTRRTFLTATAAVGALGTAGCLGGDGSDPEGTVVEPDGGPPETAITTASIPDSPFTYEAMGDDDTPVVTYYANWKCPGCASFSDGLFEEIAAEYVATGDVLVEHRALAYADGDPLMGADNPRIARAGLALWDIEPESFWPYYKLAMLEQPSPSTEWGTMETLLNLAAAAGIEEIDAFEAAIEDEAYDDAVRSTTEDAFDIGISATPSLVIDGEIFTPLDEAEETRQRLDSLVE
ncbi:MAG: thioredoxin domain-containing protein [Natronomonas sp.]